MTRLSKEIRHHWFEWENEYEQALEANRARKYMKELTPQHSQSILEWCLFKYYNFEIKINEK